MTLGWAYWGLVVLTAGGALFPFAAALSKNFAIRMAFGVCAAVVCTVFSVLEIADARKYNDAIQPCFAITLVSLLAGLAIAKWRDDRKFAPYAVGAVAIWILLVGLAGIAFLHYPEPLSSVLFFRVMPVYLTVVIALVLAAAGRQFCRQAFARSKSGT
ncbi:MAG TPA: hypothetical protein VGZ02_09130 [Candidatus Baltobacteraceae bacterium]|jgi:membrane protein DedA with SNARE-associated domain|nr:hypothetical protein [Candidatus Baltobacteraceae bacterium]